MSQDNKPNLSQYQEFLKKIDQKVEEIFANHSSQITCKLGCFSCCKPNLTVNSMEFENIKNYLLQTPEALEKAKTAVSKNYHKGKGCKLLDSKGACTIYPVRPVVCRTHGAPLQFRDLKTEDIFRDVCPLNFTSADLASVSQNDVLNLDTVNTILGMFANKQRHPLESVINGL